MKSLNVLTLYYRKNFPKLISKNNWAYPKSMLENCKKWLLQSVTRSTFCVINQSFRAFELKLIIQFWISKSQIDS